MKRRVICCPSSLFFFSPCGKGGSDIGNNVGIAWATRINQRGKGDEGGNPKMVDLVISDYGIQSKDGNGRW